MREIFQFSIFNFQLNLQSIKQRFGIIGTSKLLDAALDTAVRVAPTELTVLIQGESGVGKEAFSKIIYQLSARKHNPFIAINCGAIPEGTINSELFGHEKGAFTGAVGERKGYFETVNGGTIFLDEIGEMPLDTQAMLLRILENGEFVRVGSSKVEKTDVRVIAATNVALQDAVNKGRFREDLFYRLSTVPIRVPSLRERPEDIYPLFRKFCSDFAEKYRAQSIQIDEKARMIIERYNWPGNIRELKNVAEQVSALSNERLVAAEDLLDRFPNLLNRSLPSKTQRNGNTNSGFEEREIMYKLLFDMKHDLNYLKTLVSELIKSNNLTVPTTFSTKKLLLPAGGFEQNFPNIEQDYKKFEHPIRNSDDFDTKPFIIPDAQQNGFIAQVEVVDENLNMMEHEKRLIIQALKKHNNRRREASDDLGISERTLYRKIKDFKLE